MAECLRRARKVGLVWSLPKDLTDEALEQQLYQSGSDASVAPEMEAKSPLGNFRGGRRCYALAMVMASNTKHGVRRELN